MARLEDITLIHNSIEPDATKEAVAGDTLGAISRCLVPERSYYWLAQENARLRAELAALEQRHSVFVGKCFDLRVLLLKTQDRVLNLRSLLARERHDKIIYRGVCAGLLHSKKKA